LRERNDFRDFSSLIVKDVPGKPVFWVFCLFLPYAVLSFLLLQFYHESDFNFLPILFCSCVLTVISFIFFYLYIILSEKKNFSDLRVVLPGIISFVLFSGSIYIYSTILALLLDPEKWLFTQDFYKVIFTWNGFTKFLSSLFLLFSVTSAWLILNCHRGKYNFKFTDNFLSSILVVTILPQPLLILWNAIHIPYQSITYSNLVIMAVIFLLLAKVVFSGLKLIEVGNLKSGGRIFVTMLIVILLFSIHDLIAREQAMMGQVIRLRPLMEKIKVEEEVIVEKKIPSKGEEVFTRVCSGCHSFDARVVGPAFNSVIPAYKNIEELKAFIKNPVKKNPDFPEMPLLGLRDEEIDAVARYLLERIKK